MTQLMMTRRQSGFTIVELLIVIVVIGILAAITIVAYNGVQVKGQQAKIKTDIAQLEKAIHAARTLSDKTLWNITGSAGVTADACGSQANGVDFAALAKTDACWVKYADTLARITTAGGVDVRNIVDPWQRPYYIYENEGRVTPSSCTKDVVGTFKRPHITWDAENLLSLSNHLTTC